MQDEKFMARETHNPTLQTTAETPLVSIVILSYNGIRYLENCLDSVRKLDYPSKEVIVVDNGSSDGSGDYVEKNYPWVKVIANRENLGFAAGNNVGIRIAKGKYVFLLNQDTEIHPHCISNLVNTMETCDEVGVCGGKICLSSERNRLQHAGGKYHMVGVAIDRGFYELDEGQYDEFEDVSFVCGTALMFRRDITSKLGLLDPVFFMYHEDVDFCLRAWLSGFRVRYVPNSIVYHRSAYFDSLITGSRQPLIEFHKNKNTILILLRDFDLSTILVWLPLTLCYRFFWLIRYISDGNPSCAKSVVNAVVWTIKNLQRISSDRQRMKLNMQNSPFDLTKRCAEISDVWREFRKLSQLSSRLKSKATQN
jgi:GT2 family glycosyltransferase